MTSIRLVGLARIGLVAASLAYAGGAAVGATSVSAGGAGDPIVTVVKIPVKVQTVDIKVPCRHFTNLAAGASAVGDQKQASEFRQAAADLGCI